MKRILIIKGASQYNAARSFCDEIQQSFCNMGNLVTMLDLTTFPDTDRTDLFDQYDMIFSLDVTGIELYNTMNVRPFFWTFLIDPPIYLNERLKQINSDVMVSCIDRRHVSYIDRYYKNVPWTCFMPHGGVTGEVPHQIPFSDKKYDAVILGSLQNIDTVNSVINSLKNSYDPMAGSIIDEALSNPNDALEAVAHRIIHGSGADFDDNMFREFMYIIRGIDALRRYYKRAALIKNLNREGIAIDIWGDGWEPLVEECPDRSKIKLHGNVSYNEAKYIIRDSRILINDMPPYYEGSHERVFVAMQCGTIAASDRSTFFEECFEDDRDILFYDTEDIQRLASRINELLNDPVKAGNIIENSSALSHRHTWDSRANAILEITEMIHSK